MMQCCFQQGTREGHGRKSRSGNLIVIARYATRCRSNKRRVTLMKQGRETVTKKTKKEIKRLKKTVTRLVTANLTLEKRIRKLEKRFRDRPRTAVDRPTTSGRDAPITNDPNPSVGGIIADGGSGIATSQRVAWKQHSYLRDRYELHLGAGTPKEDARQLANEDLKKKYGTDSGFSEDELSAILT